MIDSNAYEAPSMTPIGTLHELTLQTKDFSGSDGISLIPNTPLGPTSP